MKDYKKEMKRMKKIEIGNRCKKMTEKEVE